MLEEQIQRARRTFDLTDAEHEASLLGLAERFLAEDAASIHVDREAPIEARIAKLLADSRRWLLEQQAPLEIGIVFAMWGEDRRLRPRSADNPRGEDALARKLRQLDWATRGTPIAWRVYAVDDGCPRGSAAIAEEIARAHPLGDRVTVLALADHLPSESGPLRNLRSSDESRKGGAITLGAMRSIEDGADAVVYTDADSSVHLGQLGLLLRPFVEGPAKVVLGNRKHPDAVVEKEAARWGIGIKTLRHMQRMVGEAIFSRGILDTQAAFKLYESLALEKIIADATIFDFSFDTDWILSAIENEVAIAQVPFAFIDSVAESASIEQGPMTTWEGLLFGLVRSVRRRGHATRDAAAMASVIEEEIDGYRDLEKIIDLLPPELVDANDDDLGNPDLMSPEALRGWLRSVKTAD